MPSRFDTAVLALAQVCRRFEPTAPADHARALDRCAAATPVPGPSLLAYHDMLLFLRAHPADAGVLRRVEAGFARVAGALRGRTAALPDALANQGLPHVDTVTRFSHDCLRWLLQQPGWRVAFESWNEPTLDLNAVLRLTLPPLERSLTTAGLDNEALLAALKVRPADRLSFLVRELARLDGTPFVKDQLFDALDLFVRLTPRDRRLSKAHNRLPMPAGLPSARMAARL